MADNKQNLDKQSNVSNEGANRNSGRESERNQGNTFDNPQDGSAWDNYRTRSLSSNPDEDASSTSNTGNMGSSGSDRSSDQER